MEKLVRNGPGRRIRDEGGDVRIATSSEMPTLLAHKLIEEAQEVFAALESGAERKALVGELIDVTAVLDGLCAALQVSAEEFEQTHSAKLQREGDFSERFVWRRASKPPRGSFPQYHLIVEGQDKWLPLEDAGATYDSGFVRVDLGQWVLDGPDNAPRRMSDIDREAIRNAADVYSAHRW